MTTQITNGIRISVETFYQPEYSRPMENKYIFSYRITIENQTEETVQLLRRFWQITDSNGIVKEVEGEGVIGEQPVIKPGEKHQYISWCHLLSDIGKMRGAYMMQRLGDKGKFRVRIPEFALIAPQKLN